MGGNTVSANYIHSVIVESNRADECILQTPPKILNSRDKHFKEIREKHTHFGIVSLGNCNITWQYSLPLTAFRPNPFEITHFWKLFFKDCNDSKSSFENRDCSYELETPVMYMIIAENPDAKASAKPNCKSLI